VSDNESGILLKRKVSVILNIDYYKKYEPIFGTWKIVQPLGEGSFGKVYEIMREDYGEIYRSALKAITVPQSESEIKSVMYDGMDEDSARKYFENFVKDIISEFILMSKLKGNSNVVSYEDHLVIPHEGKIGWDILIRMELLTPLMDYAKNNTFTQRDIIKLGIDMCNALETCQKRNIIHRDIKPDNIFISSDGNFKLGDFGIARTIEKTTSGLSKKGTYTYMAPEVYRGDAYGSAVDIYSLGIVMYRLINKNRTPFMPPYPEAITHTDRENSLMRRISGEAIPPPAGAQGRLAEIVLKACSYRPAERYSSPIQMREELEAIQYTSGEAVDIYPHGDTMSIKSVEYVDSNALHPDDSRPDTIDIEDVTNLLPMEFVTTPKVDGKKSIDAKLHTKAKKKPLLLITIPVFFVVLTTVIVLFLIYNSDTNPEDNQPTIADSIIAPTPEVTADSTPIPTPSATPTTPPNLIPIPSPTDTVSTNEQIQSGIIEFECDNFEAEVRWYLRKPEGEHILISDVADIIHFSASDREITSIAGIEHFTSLQELTITQNSISRLDMRHNPELRGLFFWGNQVEYIDVSQNTYLRTLVAQGNRLTSLDLSNNPELIEVFCDHNQLTELDVTANPKLIQLMCGYNQLTELDLRNNTLLELLFVDGNRIQSENDISGLMELTALDRNNPDKYRFSPQSR
jgi:serine/threonine protein kinase